MPGTLIAKQPSVRNFLHPKNFDVPSNTFKVTQSMSDFEFDKPNKLLQSKRFIENSINFKQKQKKAKKSKALFMILKAIESEDSSSSQEEAQGDSDHQTAEETRVNVLTEVDQEILKKYGSIRFFRYFHQISLCGSNKQSHCVTT